MSTEVLLRGFVALCFSTALAFGIYNRNSLEASGDGTQQRYVAYLPSFLLPMFLVGLGLAFLLSTDAQLTARTMFSICFGVFLHTSLYFIVLLLTLPLLRRYISARARAVLWLLPNYLYFSEMDYMELPQAVSKATARSITHSPQPPKWGSNFYKKRKTV